MAYVTPSPLRPWSYFPLGFRAYRDTFRFSGRARRMEVLEFYILSIFVNLAFGLLRMVVPEIELASPPETFLANRMAIEIAQLLLALPCLALMVRRIRDIGLPGWPALPLMIYVVAINAWDKLAVITALHPVSIWGSLAFLVPSERPSATLEILAIPIVVALTIAVFIPGQAGPNRYGPDPLDEPEPESDYAHHA